MKYRAEIDGLRAVAVLPVILFHAGMPQFHGGFLGVDIFFVISGYLITTILVGDLDGDKFSIVKFYERRARRILPALLFVILCSLPFAWAWLAPTQLEDFGKSVLSVAFFVSNMFFWRHSGYFDVTAELNPLLHTWSLAVEEQYYIFFPIALLLIWKINRRWIIPALLVAIAASLGAAEWGSRHAPTANFFLAPTRFWEILIGSLCAMLFREGLVKGNRWGGLLGFAMIVGGMAYFTADTPNPSLLTLIPVAGTALVILYATPGTLAAQILSVRPLVWIGLVSYSAYLWHQPMLAFARIRMPDGPGPLAIGAIIVATFVLAWISWRFVEQPFRHPSPAWLTRKRIFAFSAVGLASFGAIGLGLAAAGGLPSRQMPSGEPFSALADAEAALVPSVGLSPACDAAEMTLSPVCRTAPNPDTVLWGDSYAMHLAPALSSSPSKIDFVQHTKSSCGPFPGIGTIKSKWEACIKFNDDVIEWILSNDDIKTVYASSSFSQLQFPLFDRDGRSVTGTDRIADLIVDSLIATSARLKAHGKTLILISSPPRNGENLGQCHMRQIMIGLPPSRCDFPRSDTTPMNKTIDRILDRLDGKVSVIRLADHLCKAGTCRTVIDGVGIYRDDGHLSIAGAELLGARMIELDSAMGQGAP